MKEEPVRTCTLERKEFYHVDRLEGVCFVLACVFSCLAEDDRMERNLISIIPVFIKHPDSVAGILF